MKAYIDIQNNNTNKSQNWLSANNGLRWQKQWAKVAKN